jgi:hypothetical protein
LVSSDANILNESDVDFSVVRWLSLDSRMFAVGSVELSEVTFREPRRTNWEIKQR